MEKKKRRYFPDEFNRQAAERTQWHRWIRHFGRSVTGSARRLTTQVHGPSPADLSPV